MREKVPARHYFVFGPAIDTSLVDEKDRGTCQAAYELTKSCVREGISFLLESRKQDPYRDGAKRWLYESVMKTQVMQHGRLLQLFLCTTLHVLYELESDSVARSCSLDVRQNTVNVLQYYFRSPLHLFSFFVMQAPTFPLDAATFDSLRWPPESDCPRGPGRDQKVD